MRPHAWLLVGAALGGCDPVEAPPAPAEEQPVFELNAETLAAADLDRGLNLSLACQACHHLAADRGHSIGPNLHGVFGRRAAVSAGFEYSDALANADVVWTPATIDAWLLDPVGFVPGTSMAFFGYSNPRDRRDLIAYLLIATGSDLDASWSSDD